MPRWRRHIPWDSGSEPHAAVNEKRRAFDRKVVRTMIGMYCRAHHAAARPADVASDGAAGDRAGLCPDCAELADYCDRRVDRCPLGDRKTSCRKCTISCYDDPHRKAIRAAMRYAGPRMLFRHPWMALKQLFHELRPVR